MKVQVAVTTNGGLLGLGAPVLGAQHDAYAWRACRLAEHLADSQIIADLGFLGVEGITTGTRRAPAGSPPIDSAPRTDR